MSSHLVREMSITHNEFFRLLPRAVNDAAVARQGNQDQPSLQVPAW